MAELSVENILARHQKADSNRRQYLDTYEAAYRFANPVRNIFFNQTKGDPRLEGMFDSTGIRALYAWVTNMTNAICPPFRRWSELRPGPGLQLFKTAEEFAAVYDEYKAKLNYATQRGFSVLNANNFNSVVPAFFADLAAGTAVLMTLPNVQEDPIPFRVVVIPIEEISLECGPANTVGAKFRKSKISAQNIEKTWPDAKLPQEIKDKVRDDPTCEVCIVEAFYESDKKHYYDIIIEDTKDRIAQRVFRYDPIIVTRLNPDPLGVYGLGPLVMATPDLRTLNKAKELMLRASQLSVYGVYTVRDNDVANPNTLRISPNTFIPVSANAGPNGPSISPLPVAGNFNAQQFQIQELQQSVKEMLFDDSLPPDTGPVRSATEIVERVRNIRKATGAFFGPINQEFVQHLWTNILHILVDRGEIDLDPDLMTVDNLFVEVEVLSPIAKEQDFEDIQTFVQTYEIVAQLMGPEAAQITFKTENVARWLAEKSGVDLELIRSRDEEQQFRMQQQEQIRAQQLQQVSQMAEQQGQ